MEYVLFQNRLDVTPRKAYIKIAIVARSSTK